ncbi:tetratricopeptide repeat protein (macronuclear) [Tetrahymena thermophila SB210]|uniref:Tetratricopeptide repeat protein n=1 Tax=Tetrahymena thermophila (strain SB210) TaxID=312017 RepID=I7MKA1_TETTS|nr:tetratricopeptide repeat protein [Tetrahymena thermophila SB210]EAR97938.2 tetratricopeptide repeat protein [Tetrahymena thermophila SB210]|eukprot:XP_001018183.2 tetratricopeptide repeat protein [Tetrahymena thermophila SB210]
MNKSEQLLREGKKFIIYSVQEYPSQSACIISGYDTTKKQKCLIKSLQLSVNSTEDVRPEKLEEVNRMIQMLKNSNNSNILQYLDSFQIENYCFIQFERPEKTIFDWIKEKKDDAIIESNDYLFKVCAQIANAMSYLHKYNCFLMDMSPEYIFLNEHGNVKIFCNKFVSSDEKDGIYKSYVRSGRDGKYFLYSPEMLSQALNIWDSGVKRKEKYDVWALGIVMLILLGQSEAVSINLHQQNCISSVIESLKIDQSLKCLLQNDIFNLNIQKRLTVQELLSFFNQDQQVILKKSDSLSIVNQESIEKEVQLQDLNNEQQDQSIEKTKSIDSDVKTQDEQEKHKEQHSRQTEKRRKRSSKKVEDSDGNEDEEEIEVEKGKVARKDSKKKKLEKNQQKLVKKDAKDQSKDDKEIDEEKKDQVKINKNIFIDNKYLKKLMSKSLSKAELVQETQNLKEHLEKQPNDIEALKVIAKLYQKRGMIDQEISHYKQIIELSPDDADVYFQLGKSYLGKSKEDEAVNCFNICFEKDNKHIDSIIKLGDYYLVQKQIKKAEDVVLKGQKVNQTNPQILYQLGNIYRLQNRLEEALECFDLSLKFDHSNKQCTQDRLQTFKKIKEVEIVNCLKALEVDSNNYKILYKLGLAYKDKDMYDKAIESLDKSLSINPKQNLVYLALGDCFLLKNNIKFAKEKYYQSLEINPKCSLTWNQLGSLYTLKKKYIKAIKAYLNSFHYSETKSPEQQVKICEIAKKQMDDCIKRFLKTTETADIHKIKKVIQTYCFTKELEINNLKEQLSQEYAQSLKDMNSFYKFFHTLGLLYMAYKIPKKGILQLQKSLILNQLNKACYIDLSAAFGTQNQKNQVIYYANQALFNYQTYKSNFLTYKEKRVLKSIQQIKKIQIDEINNEISQDDLKSKAYYNIAHVLENKINLSIGYYNRSLKLDQKNAESYYRTGILLFKQNMFENSIKSLNNCIKIDKYHLGAHEQLIQIYEVQQNKELEIYHKKTLKESKAFKKYIYYMQNKDYEKCIQLLQEWEEINPTNDECQYYLSDLMRIIGKKDSQVHYLKQCLTLNPTHELALQRKYELQNSCQNEQLAQTIFYEELDQHNNWEYVEQEENEFQNLLSIRSNSYISFKSGLYMKSKQDLSKAFLYFEEYSNQQPNDYLGFYLLGHIEEKNCNFEVAANFYLKSLQLKPEDNFNSNNRLGIVYLNMKKVEEALKYLNEAKKIIHKEEINICAIAQCYSSLGQFKEAIENYQICLQINPNNQLYEFFIFVINSRKLNLDDFFPEMKKKAVVVYEAYKNKNISSVMLHFLECIINEKEHKNNCSGFCLYQLSKLSTQHKKIEEAVEHLKQSVRISPNYPPFRLAFAQNLISLLKYDKASEELEKILQQDSENYDANHFMGICQYQKNQFKSAIQYLSVCEAQKPNTYEIIKLIGQCHKQMNQTEKAIQFFELCIDQNPKDAEVLILLAESLYKQGDVKQTLEMYQKAFKYNTKDSQYFYQYAKILFETKDFNQAIIFAQECIKINSSLDNAQNLLGLCYMNIGDMNKAIAAFKKQGQINRLHKDYLLNLGKAYIKKGQTVDAISTLSKFMNLYPDIEETYELLNYLFDLQQQPKKQIKILQNLLEKYPKKTKLNLNIADIQYKQKLYQEAIESYEKYLKENEGSREIQYRVAMCYVRKNLLKEANEILNKSIALYPDMIEYRYHLANVNLALGNYEESQKNIELLLEHNPDHISGLFILAKLQFIQKDYKNALEKLEICLNTYDQIPELYYLLGCCYKKLGMKDLCLPCFEAAIVRNPEDMNSKIKLGYFYIKAKEYQKGLTLLENFENFENLFDFNDPKYYYYLAESYFNLNQLPKAHKLYQKCFECSSSKYSKFCFQKIHTTLLKQKKYDEIKKSLSGYINKYSDDFEVYFILAQVYAYEGIEYQKVLEYTQKALELKPSYDECKVLLGFCYLNIQKDLTKTIEFYNEFDVKFVDQNVNALLVLSQAYFQQENTEKCQEFLNKLLQIDNKHENALYLQGMLYVKLKQIDKAILEFQKNDQHDKSFYQLGVLKKKQKKYDEARSSFNKAIQLNSNDPLYYEAFGKLEYGQKEYLKACNHFEKYLQKVANPEIEIINLNAQSYYNIKMYKEAINLCDKSVEICLQDDNQKKQILSKSYHLIGLCYYQQSEYKKAEEFFLKSTNADPQNSESFFWLGNILKLLNEQQEAKKAYLTCLSLNKEHALCLNYLGEIYYKEKEEESAKKCFIESILYDTQNPNSHVNLGKYFQKVKNNLSLAEENYKKSVQIEKSNKRGAKKLLKVYILQNKYEEADKTIAEYQHLFDNDASLLLFFGNFYFNRHKYDNAISQYEKSLKVQDQNQECMIKIISSYFMKKSFTQCNDSLKKYSNQLENNFMYHFLKAQILIYNETDSQIVRCIKKCLQINKDNENIQYLQAYFFYCKGSKKYQEYYEEGNKLNPASNSELKLILQGIIHAEKKEEELAIKSFNTCLSLYPKSELCLLNQGYYYLNKEMYEEAKEALQKCLNYDFVSLQSIYSKPLTLKDIHKLKIGLSLAYKEVKDIDKSFALIKQCLDKNPNDPEVIKLHAKVLQQQGNLSSSIIQYQKYLSSNPNSYEVQYLLGKARLEIGCPDQAIYSLKKCLQLNPKFPNINGILGEAYEQDQQYLEALIHYQKQTQINPENTEILFKMALIQISYDNFNQAKQLIDKLIELKPQDYLVYSAQAYLYKRQGNLQEAIKSFDQSLSIQPTNTFTLFNLALCHGELGNIKQEKKMYKEIQKISPNDRKMLNNLGIIYRQKGKYEKAIQLFSQCIKLDQYFCDYFTNLGLCYYAKGDYDGAINYFQKGYTLDRINVECLLNLASALKAKGEPQQAIKYLQKIIKINPNYTAAYYNLGIIQKQNGNISDAQTSFKLSIEKDPYHINSVIQLAIIYREQNDYDNSKKLLKQALEIDSNNELANFNIALLYRQKCKHAKELNALLKALSYSPKNAKYLHNIGICQRLQENYQEALIYFKQSVQIDSENAKYYYNLADIYNCLKMPIEEINCYMKCIQLNPNFERAHYNLGIAYENIKNYKEAISCFEKCIEIAPSNDQYFFSLGNIYSLQRNFEKSNEYYQFCISLNQDNIECLNNMAVNYIKLKQHSEAIKIYQNCLKISPFQEEFKKKINLIQNYLHHQS